MLAASAFKGYIDNQPYLVDMRVRLLQQTRNDKIDHVLYYYTPEEIVSVKKVGTTPPTDERRALIGASEGVPTLPTSVPHSAQSVNEQKLHIAPPQKSELIQEGYRLLKSGQMVSDELLSAMGVTQRQAKSIVNAARTNTNTRLTTTNETDYTPYLEQLKQAQRDKKVRDLQNAYQKFVESEQKTAGTVKSVEQSASDSDPETEFKKVLETAASGGKIELSEEMEKYIANKPFEEIEGLRGRLSDRAARRWYLANDAKILGQIDKGASLEQQARQAFELRNLYRTQTRDLMANKRGRRQLNRKEPNKTFDQLLMHKMKDKGLTYEEALKDTIATSGKTRSSTNQKYGLE